MKFLPALIIVLSITTQVLAQTCLPEGITFSTQTGINNFPSNYPGCSIILGDVIIDDMEISTVTNVDSLLYLTEIQGNLHIGTQYATPYFSSLEGFSNLSNIGGDLDIGGNFDLYSLTGLENLITIGGLLNIHNNNYLSNLEGLDDLHSVGSVRVSGNDGLTSLTGLDSIDYTSLSSLNITNNDVLTMCNIYSICAYINSENPDVIIAYNDLGCANQTQVEELCITDINDHFSNDISMNLYPNPAKDNLEIIFDDNLSPLFKYSIFNLNGQTIVFNMHYHSHTEIKVSSLSSGIYILKLELESGESTMRKFIKE